jgi:hypothetical protein
MIILGNNDNAVWGKLLQKLKVRMKRENKKLRK